MDFEDKGAFLTSLVGSPNLDEWIKRNASEATQEAWAANVEARWGEIVWPLPSHWHRNTVYEAFTDEIWKAVEDLGEWLVNTPSVLRGLAELGDADLVENHREFVDVMVARGLAVVAEDVLAKRERAH